MLNYYIFRRESRMALGFFILGLIIAFIALFSLITAIQQRTSKFTIILVLIIALLGTTWAFFKLPYWSHQKSTVSHVEDKKISKIPQSQVFASKPATQSEKRIDNEQLIKHQLSKNLAKLGVVSFSHSTKTFTLNITHHDLQKTISFLNENSNQAEKLKWPRFANSFTETSYSIKKSLGKGYKLVICNKNDSPVLIYKDGFIIKNRFE